MKSFVLAAAAIALTAGSALAQTYTIDFDTDAAGNPIADGTTISNQYVAWGALFVPNLLDPAAGWATNTDMTATSTDVGGGYLPAYGNILHSFDGWFNEDGDPNFGIFFSSPISEITVRFTGDTGGLSEVGVFDGAGNFITAAGVVGGDANLKSITISGLSTAEIGLVLPGSFGDWVGVVDVTYTLIPTPASLALVGAGGLLAARRRR
jgi:hypothetical protein